MWTFLTIVSLTLNLYLLVRFFRLRKFLGTFTKQLERRQSYLYVRPGQWADGFFLGRLTSLVINLLRENEQSSLQSRSYLQQIETTLSHLAEAVFITDRERRIVLANPAARNLLDLRSDYHGLRLESVIPSSDFLSLMERIREGQVSGRKVVELSRARRTQHFEVVASQMPNAAEPNEHLAIIILHDISRMVELERVRRDFVANVSHELRTPVTVIKGFSEALLDDADELSVENQRVFLEKIRRNTERLNALLEDLLTLSRLESGRQSVDWERLDLHALIQELVEALSERGLPEGVTIGLDLASNTRLVELDGLKIHQVLQNLTDNALRYAKGMTCLTISTRAEGAWLYLSVKDDGCGIPERDVPHLFERFYRVDKGRSREHGGTGLGLSIVRHIVNLHGGNARVESHLGEGTEIILQLPFRPVEVERTT